MGHLGRGIAAEIADTEGALMGLGCQVLGADTARGALEAKVPVLAGDTVEGAGFVEDGQVDLTPLPASLADPVGHAVGGQGVIVPTHQRPPRRTRQVDQPAIAHRAQAT